MDCRPDRRSVHFFSPRHYNHDEDMMKTKLTTLFLILALVPLPSFSEGVGFYVEPYPGYRTADGSPYSYSECQASASEYPVGTILSIGSDAGENIPVYVNDTSDPMPDRKLEVNTYTASLLGLDKTGWDDLEVSVVLGSSPSEPIATGWYSYEVATFQSVAEAYDAAVLLRNNGLKTSAAMSDSGTTLFLRYITAYQAKATEAKLAELGFPSFLKHDEENPYL